MNTSALSTGKKKGKRKRKKIKAGSERGSKRRGKKVISCWKKQETFGLEFN